MIRSIFIFVFLFPIHASTAGRARLRRSRSEFPRGFEPLPACHGAILFPVCARFWETLLAFRRRTA